MPEINTPSIWDYIAQAGNQGVQNFQQAKQETDRKAAVQTQFMGQLLDSGAIDSDAFNANPLIKNQGIVVKPGKMELARKIIASPDLNPDTKLPWTVEEQTMAGMPTVTDKKVLKAKGTTADLQAQTDQATSDYAAGKPLNDQQYALLKLPTPDDLANGKLAAQDKVLGTMGPRVLDDALAPVMSANQGRIPTHGFNAIIDDAFARYTVAAKSSGIRVNPNARQYFATQLIDRLTEQKKLDIQRTAAENAGRQRISQDPADKTFQQLQNVINNRTQQLKDISNDPQMNFMINHPSPENNANPAVIRYHAVSKALENAMNLQRKVTLGGVPNSDDMKMLGVGDEAPGAGPTSSGIDISGIVSMIKNKKATTKDLSDMLTGKKISQADYDNVMSQLKVKK